MSDDTKPFNNVMRHGYRKLTDQEKLDMSNVKDKGLEFWELVDKLGAGRELAIAKTKIEEAVLWAVKHVSR